MGGVQSMSRLLSRRRHLWRLGRDRAETTKQLKPPTGDYAGAQTLYVAGRWFYVDPTHAWSTDFPSYRERRSIGAPRANSVDYAMPFKITPVPGSKLAHVPYLGE